jgi:hypothetical protein
MKTNAQVLGLILVLAGCGGGSSTGDGGSGETRPAFLLVQMDLLPSVTTEAARGITSVEVVLAPRPGFPAPQFVPFLWVGTVNGLPVVAKTRPREDGNLEVLITVSGNMFAGDRRRAEIYMYPEIQPANPTDAGLGDAGASGLAPVSVNVRVFTTSANVLLAEGETATDVNGEAIVFSTKDRTVQVPLACATGAPCDQTPPPVKPKTGSVTIEVSRLRNCPTTAFQGDLYVFLLPNPLVPPGPERQGGSRPGLDLSPPETRFTLTLQEVPVGTYYAVAIQDVGHRFATGDYTLVTGDLISTMRPVTVLENATTNLALIIDQVVGVGMCSPDAPGAVLVSVSRLNTCPAVDFEGDLHVFAQPRPGSGPGAQSAMAVSRGVSFANPATVINLNVPVSQPGTYWITALFDPRLAGPLGPGDFLPGDIISSTPVAVTVLPGQTALATVLLDTVVGSGPCTAGVDVAGTVVDALSVPLPTSIVILGQPGPTQLLGVADRLGRFRFSDVSTPYDLTVVPPSLADGGVLDGIVSFLQVSELNPLVKLPLLATAGHSAILQVNFPLQTASGEVVAATPFGPVASADVNATNGAATLYLDWDGPDQVDVLVAGAGYNNPSGTPILVDFAFRTVRVGANNTVTLAFPPAASRIQVGNRQVAITNAAGTTVFPMMDYGGVRFRIPGHLPGGYVGPTSLQILSDNDCAAPCNQYLVARLATNDSFQRCEQVRVWRSSFLTGLSTVNVTLPQTLTITSPASQRSATPVTLPVRITYGQSGPGLGYGGGYLLMLENPSETDRVRQAVWTLTPPGTPVTIPDLSVVGTRPPASANYTLSVQAASSGLDPGSAIRNGRFPLRPERCSGEPLLFYGAGEHTGAAFRAVEVLP